MIRAFYRCCFATALCMGASSLHADIQLTENLAVAGFVDMSWSNTGTDSSISYSLESESGQLELGPHTYTWDASLATWDVDGEFYLKSDGVIYTASNFLPREGNLINYSGVTDIPYTLQHDLSDLLIHVYENKLEVFIDVSYQPTQISNDRDMEVFATDTIYLDALGGLNIGQGTLLLSSENGDINFGDTGVFSSNLDLPVIDPILILSNDLIVSNENTTKITDTDDSGAIGNISLTADISVGAVVLADTVENSAGEIDAGLISLRPSDVYTVSIGPGDGDIIINEMNDCLPTVDMLVSDDCYTLISTGDVVRVDVDDDDIDLINGQIGNLTTTSGSNSIGVVSDTFVIEETVLDDGYDDYLIINTLLRPSPDTWIDISNPGTQFSLEEAIYLDINPDTHPQLRFMIEKLGLSQALDSFERITEDDDRDGLPALLELALCTDMSAPTTPPWQTRLMENENGEVYACLVFNRPAGALNSGLAYCLEFSSDLTNWERDEQLSELEILETNGEVETVCLRYVEPMGNQAIYLRLAVDLIYDEPQVFATESSSGSATQSNLIISSP